jgi:hypothetical protein
MADIKEVQQMGYARLLGLIALWSGKHFVQFQALITVVIIGIRKIIYGLNYKSNPQPNYLPAFVTSGTYLKQVIKQS